MAAETDDGTPPRFVRMEQAAQARAERRINPAWVATVLHGPERTEADRNDSTVRRGLGRIAERDGRVLRVVYDSRGAPPRFVTTSFDRSQPSLRRGRAAPPFGADVTHPTAGPVSHR